MFYNKMDVFFRMIVFYNVKHRYAVRIQFGDKLLTSLTKLVVEAKASICSTIKKSTFILS